MVIKKMFSLSWLLSTLLVWVGCAVCIRLGIWQLDRLDERRVFNSQVAYMRSLPPLDLNASLNQDITKMEWRAVKASGSYDFENQIALRNQYNGDQYGYHLITPLLLSNTDAVMVDRGWIPAEGNSLARDWRIYDEPGAVVVYGQIRHGTSKPAYGGVADPTPSPGQNRLEIWNNLDLMRITEQMPYSILDIYIQLNENVEVTKPPIPYQPELDLSEGPHLGYALQWFTFAALLFLGYPIYLRKQEGRTQ